MDIINQFFLYVFSPAPGKGFLYSYLLWVVTAILAGGGIALIVFMRNNKSDKAFKKVFRAYPAKLLTVGIILGLYLLGRGNAIPFFSMRFILFIILLTAAFTGYRLFMAYTREYPAEKKRRTDRNEMNKYIPRKHGKK